MPCNRSQPQWQLQRKVFGALTSILTGLQTVRSNRVCQRARPVRIHFRSQSQHIPSATYKHDNRKLVRRMMRAKPKSSSSNRLSSVRRFKRANAADAIVSPVQIRSSKFMNIMQNPITCGLPVPSRAWHSVSRFHGSAGYSTCGIVHPQ